MEVDDAHAIINIVVERAELVWMPCQTLHSPSIPYFFLGGRDRDLEYIIWQRVMSLAADPALVLVEELFVLVIVEQGALRTVDHADALVAVVDHILLVPVLVQLGHVRPRPLRARNS